MLGRPLDDEETLVRTMTVSGQLHVFQMARRSVLMKLKWDRITDARLDLLKRVLREHSGVLLRAMVKARDSDCTVSKLADKRPAAKVVAAKAALPKAALPKVGAPKAKKKRLAASA